MVNRAPVPRNAALCGGHRAIRSILGGAHGHCVPSAPPKDAAPIAGAGSLKLTFLFLIISAFPHLQPQQLPLPLDNIFVIPLDHS